VSQPIGQENKPNQKKPNNSARKAGAERISLNAYAFKERSIYAENRREKDMIAISKEAIEHLKSKVKGQIVLPSDSRYDEVRKYGMR